jgi:hypothetical protein
MKVIELLLFFFQTLASPDSAAATDCEVNPTPAS